MDPPEKPEKQKEEVTVKSDTKTKVDDNAEEVGLNSDENSCKAKKTVTFSKDLVSESAPPRNPDSSPLTNLSPPDFQSRVESVRGALGRWRKRVGEATKKAEDLAGNTWQHLKTGPSFTDAALGRIVRGTKVLAEGGYEKIFQQTFETDPEEKLQDSFACYMSTSVGPVMGVLYVSTEKLAYCSDSPLSYKDNDTTQWSYYKVTIPLDELKAVNPSANISNSSEKYIQVISLDNQEFWFMGFLYYSAAVDLLKEILEVRNLQPT